MIPHHHTREFILGVFDAITDLRANRDDLNEDDTRLPDLKALNDHHNARLLQKLGITHRTAALLKKDVTAISRFSARLGAERE